MHLAADPPLPNDPCDSHIAKHCHQDIGACYTHQAPEGQEGIEGLNSITVDQHIPALPLAPKHT